MRKANERAHDWVKRIKNEIPDPAERAEYWRMQPDQTKFDAAWQLVIEHAKEHGLSLKMDRTKTKLRHLHDPE